MEYYYGIGYYKDRELERKLGELKGELDAIVDSSDKRIKELEISSNERIRKLEIFIEELFKKEKLDNTSKNNEKEKTDRASNIHSRVEESTSNNKKESISQSDSSLNNVIIETNQN